MLTYIMPPMSGPAGMAGSGLGISTMVASVVSKRLATEAAFSSATRVTLVGSMMPASCMLQ